MKFDELSPKLKVKLIKSTFNIKVKSIFRNIEKLAFLFKKKVIDKDQYNLLSKWFGTAINNDCKCGKCFNFSKLLERPLDSELEILIKHSIDTTQKRYNRKGNDK